jgi:hypothetical protein
VPTIPSRSSATPAQASVNTAQSDGTEIREKRDFDAVSQAGPASNMFHTSQTSSDAERARREDEDLAAAIAASLVSAAGATAATPPDGAGAASAAAATTDHRQADKRRRKDESSSNVLPFRLTAFPQQTGKQVAAMLGGREVLFTTTLREILRLNILVRVVFFQLWSAYIC